MTEPLDLKNNYIGGDYVYKMGGDGFQTNAAGKKKIDCSHMVNLLLTGAGYQIPYEDTRDMDVSTYYTTIEPQNVKRGDIALWINANSHQGGSPLFHTGIVEDFNPATNAGHIFGAQTSTGPANAVFGPKPPSHYWPVATKFLRAKESFRTGTAPAASPVPAPAPAGPAPQMNFQYPIRKADGKQFNDAEEIYKALEGEKSGHYLLGSNRFWHGGIHISDASAPQCVLNEPVRCMADGEVVAYRLNQDYLESTFGDNEKKLKYSNSFCLVRHEYKSAPNPEEGPNKGKQNKLNFYSLYMHLLPYARYPLAPEETPKPVVTMNFGDYKGYDKAPWIPGAHSYGLIKKGTKLEILDQAVEGVKTYAKGKILAGSVNSGSTKTRSVGDEIWFAFKQNDIPYQNSQHKAIWTADKVPQRLRPNYWQGKVKATAISKLDLYEAPTALQNGQPAGARIGSMQLIPGSVVEFDSKEILNLNVAGVTRRMAKCTKVSGALAGAGSVPPSFWTCVENAPDFRMLDWTNLTPSSFDSVETASTGIKAGDPIGYLGQTENLTGEDGSVSSKYQVHVEIFTAEADVTDFLKNVAGLKIGKQYLHLVAGAELKKKAPATGSTPLKKEHAVDLSKAPIVKEGTEDWYEVSVVEDDQPLAGLVKKTSAEIITQYDWEKLGFQIVEESNPTADGFLDPQDMPQFFKDLFAKIDKNHDGNVDPGELADALKNADTRDQWAKLIAHHPTEWKDKAESPKWSKLDKLLETSPKTLVHEKERISKYVFWAELTGKAAISSDVIWHFHPIEFVSNSMLRASFKITLAMLKKVFTTGDDAKLQLLADELNPRLADYKLDTPLRLSHFFAQVRVEVGDGYALVESLAYRPEKLASFSYFSSRPDEADLYGYKPGEHPANQVEIANRAYNGVTGVTDLGNGNIASGDGWKYRGRGLKQLTGRYNYNEFTTLYPQLWPGENLSFINNPELLEQPKYAARSAVFFWLKNSLFEIADKGDAPELVNSITAKINLHTNSYGDRRTQFTRIWTNEKIFR